MRLDSVLCFRTTNTTSKHYVERCRGHIVFITRLAPLGDVTARMHRLYTVTQLPSSLPFCTAPDDHLRVGTSSGLARIATASENSKEGNAFYYGTNLRPLC